MGVGAGWSPVNSAGMPNMGVSSQPKPTATSASSSPSTSSNPYPNPIAPDSPGTPVPNTPAPAGSNPNMQTPNPSTPAGQTLLPPSLTNSFQNASQVFGQLGTNAMSNIPGVTSFINAEMGPNMTPANQAYLNYSSQLGLQGLQNTLQGVEGQFQQAPFSSSLANAEMSAANQYASQMGQTGAGLAASQQQTAAGLASLPYQAAYQNAAALPSTQEGLYNLLMQTQQQGLPAGALGLYQNAPAGGNAVSAGKKGG